MECEVLRCNTKTITDKMKEFKYTIEGKEYEVTIAAIDENNVADITVNGESYKVQIEKEAEPEKKKVVLGQPVEAAADDAPAATNVNTSNAIKAPLPGTITQICVEVGQEVKAGDTLVVLEAMKMQSMVKAPKDCRVMKVSCADNDSVMANQELMLLEFEE